MLHIVALCSHIYASSHFVRVIHVLKGFWQFYNDIHLFRVNSSTNYLSLHGTNKHLSHPALGGNCKYFHIVNIILFDKKLSDYLDSA